jgi:DNA-binding MarR family transcriptional regulator
MGRRRFDMAGNNYKSSMSIDERVLMAVVRTAERFRKQVSAIFKNYGLSFPQYNVLRVLDASEGGRNTLKSVNQIMLVSGANMTGITKRLEKTGCIIRTTDPNDERSKWLEITPRGKQLLVSISEEHERRIKRFLQNFSDENKSELLRLLREILHSK